MIEKLKIISKWTFISIVVGLCSGVSSAIFLISLEFVTNLREATPSLLYLLPIGGGIIGFLYFYYGKNIEKGNELIFDEYQNPKKGVPIIMAPFIYFTTLITHLFGGSAGREGTAIQMSGAIADSLKNYFKIDNEGRKSILLMGIAGGFSSVFGTPFSAIVFAYEIINPSKKSIISIPFIIIASFMANYSCLQLGVKHSDFYIYNFPEISYFKLVYVIPAGVLFGLFAFAFIQIKNVISKLFAKYIHYAPLRPVVGGVIFLIITVFIGTNRYLGLGVPVIESAFNTVLPIYDSIAKLLFTAFTLGVGFKGGEVTPLFYIGATLGNAISQVIPFPMALMAAIGFVSVFGGATNTPLASIILGVELFGLNTLPYVALGCLVAYIFSGTNSVYSSSKIDKNNLFVFQKYFKLIP